MSEVTNYTNPLGGHEVVADVLAQIKKRLATDCNLRATDGYSGGYSGTVTIKLRLHAVRIAEVEVETAIIAPPTAPGPETFPPEDVFPAEIDEVIEIPIEPNLAEVRSRTEENEHAEDEPTPVEAEANVVAPAGKRKYRKRTALLEEETAGISF